MSDYVYTSWASKAFRPHQRLTVSQWADQNRILSSKSAAEPGFYRTERTPYLREIMDCLSVTTRIKEVIVMKAAQIGFTETGNNWVGYCIHHAPAPFLVVQPTVDLAKRNSKTRIDPLIEESESLSKLVMEKRARDSSNTMLAKEFPGGVLVMTGANSPTGLRSMPAKYLFLDEIDAYPLDAGGEGDPLKLADARTRTFSNSKKVLLGSTPTIEGRSKIAEVYDMTDQRKYFVPCPFCGEYQSLVFENLKWEKNDFKSVAYECVHCKDLIAEHHKTKMLAAGEWRMTNVDNADPERRGYHISALYSPLGWYSWEKIAKDFTEDSKNPDRLRVFVNTVLGETWKEKGDAPEWDRLYERRESYDIGTVPAGVVFLTAGVDIQKDRIEVQVVGWGVDKQAWSIDYVVIEGDTSNIETLDKLNQVLDSVYTAEDEFQFQIRVMAVDSGFNTQTVYNWCRKHPINRVIAVKGQENLQTIIGNGRAVDVKKNRSIAKRAYKFFPVGVSLLKSQIYSHLNMSKPVEGEEYPPSFYHFPQYEPEFFKMLTAEQLVKRVVRGYPKYIWEKIRDRNEALDTLVYARAAASYFGIDRFMAPQWEALQLQKEKNIEKIQKSNQTSGKIKRRKSEWL